MDLFDLLVWVPSDSRRARRSRAENLAANLVLFGLPAIYVTVLLLGGLGVDDATVVLVVLPLAFGALGWLICRRLRIGAGYSLQLTLGCAGLCLLWGVCLLLLDVLIFPF
jgi:hypothetical protein